MELAQKIFKNHPSACQIENLLPYLQWWNGGTQSERPLLHHMKKGSNEEEIERERFENSDSV